MNDNEVTSNQIVYEFTRAATLQGWWSWALLVAAIGLIVQLCVWLYRRDVDELPQGVRWTLIAMRLTTIAALIFFFFDLQRRTERLVTRPSEVVILVDTSQSMSLPAGSAADSASRVERATELIDASGLLRRLADEHRTSVYAFDSAPEPRLLETRSSGKESGDASSGDGDPPGDDGDDGNDRDRNDRDGEGPESAASVPGPSDPLAMFGLVCVGAAVLLSAGTLVIGAAGRGASIGWLLFACAICLTLGVVSLGGVYAVDTGRSFAEIVGADAWVGGDTDGGSGSAPQGDGDAGSAGEEAADGEGQNGEVPDGPRVTDWSERLAAAGTESRIGDAIRGVLVDHDPSTLAGVLVVSDGQSNGGADVTLAASAARQNGVALYPVGLGSSDAPVNVRVVDLEAPRRVYPGDRFAVSAVLQASGPEPVTVEVQLLDRLDNEDSGEEDAEEDDAGDGTNDVSSGTEGSGSGEGEFGGEVVDSQRVRLDTDGTLSGIRFELEPESVGRRRLAVRVVAPAEDQNRRDDIRDARYEVVARKLRVLAVAGGPTREYRFVRNLLFRDSSVELDVWLQTGQPGMSQDADGVLRGFPSTPEELFEYDVVMFFDPDWMALDAEQLDLIDRWLTRQAGGMVLVAGPVYHPRWTRVRTDPRVNRISGFFPVNLATRGPLLGGGRQGGENAWPLEFTDEARRAEFLRITDDPQTSFERWDEFDGVYDYVGVQDAKPGAKVYARFSDPTAEVGGELPIYLASQFYGAGRVFFQGSGEMWRLRGEGDALFDSYYTKLVRWVSEGRLLRDSNRGVLLVDNQRAMVGDTISVRAVLSDDQFEPLELPEVTAKVLLPGGRIDDLRLRPLPGEPRPGTYGGRMTVRESGSYEIRLTLGDALSEQVLRQAIQVRLPAIELERPRRNDDELDQLASVTGGRYYPIDRGVDVPMLATELASTIRPQPQTMVLPGTPDRDFHERRNAVLIWLIASALTLEWVTRRLHRLA